MDISKINGDEQVLLCKKYFYIGLCCLPMVWITNFFWFFQEAFCKPSNPNRQILRKYVILSGIGVIFWLIVLISWETIFQSYRSQGLPWSDYITFVFPTGRI